MHYRDRVGAQSFVMVFQGPRFKGVLSEHGMAVSHSQLASQPTVPGPRFDGRSRFGPSISMA